MFPPPLDSSPVRVVAPSGPFERDALEAGLAVLQRYSSELRVSDELWSRRDGFFAASDEHRRSELQSALDEVDTGLIAVARGGYGISRIIQNLDWSGFKRNPKWIMGFSDVTVLHLEALKHGIATLHGPNITTLPKLNLSDLERLDQLLNAPASIDSLHLKPLNQSADLLMQLPQSGRRAMLIGGNLTVLAAELAAGQVVNFARSWLALEDISETSYRIDRMLLALKRRFESLEPTLRPKGLLFGEFTDCSPGKWNVPVTEVLEQFSQEFNLPVFGGFSFGHGERNYSFIHGSQAIINP